MPLPTRADRNTVAQKTPTYYSDFLDNFIRHPVTNALAVATNAAAVIQAIKNLVNTNLEDRPFEPLVGTNTRASLFEPNDFIASDSLTTNITYAINTYEKRANLISVVVTPSADQNSLYIAITFSLINNPTPISFNMILKRVR